jgi:beta-hydroxyacyl-ACP dehydratase FabZ
LSEDSPSRDIVWVKSILPHRYPFLLIDRVLELEPKKHIRALKNFTGNEDFFAGHFPERPVVPGVMLIEGMAQAGGILLLHDIPEQERKLVYFMTIEKARFRHPVVPGDQVVFEVDVLRLRSTTCKLSARALVGDKLVAEAICTSAMVDR